MKRIKDTYLQTMQTYIDFQGKSVLEIGCGEGTRTMQIAERAKHVTAIEPDIDALNRAKQNRQTPNILYLEGSADVLAFPEKVFDIVLFTLSFHHVPESRMKHALDEAARVVKDDGFVVLFEPAFEGTFFQAEIAFDACDGDERKQKAMAYATMLSHPQLEEVVELEDETIFAFDSYEDFLSSMHPKRDIDQLRTFLEKNNYTLNAKRRINIFKIHS